MEQGVPILGIFGVNEAIFNQPMPEYGAWPHDWLVGPDRNVFSWAFDNSTAWFGQTFRWVRDREKQIRGSGGSLEPPGPLLEPPGPLLTHLHTVYIAYSECLPTRLNPLAERTCFSQASGSSSTSPPRSPPSARTG